VILNASTVEMELVILTAERIPLIVPRIVEQVVFLIVLNNVIKTIVIGMIPVANGKINMMSVEMILAQAGEMNIAIRVMFIVKELVMIEDVLGVFATLTLVQNVI
jgi:hypothetical protein